MRLAASEALLEYQSLVRAAGQVYRARACAAEAGDGTKRWHGWIEFRSLDGVSAMCTTGRETTQPNRICVAYWATGLTAVYLEGALGRALRLRSQPRTDANSSQTRASSRGRDRSLRAPRPSSVTSRRAPTSRVKLTRFDRWWLKSVGIIPR